MSIKKYIAYRRYNYEKDIIFEEVNGHSPYLNDMCEIKENTSPENVFPYLDKYLTLEQQVQKIHVIHKIKELLIVDRISKKYPKKPILKMKNKEQILSEIENCELMISIEHLKDYNLIKKYWLEWVLNNE